MNSAPVSAKDLALFRKRYAEKLGPDMDRQRVIMASAAYKQGDPEAVAARYRLHFKLALRRIEDYEKLMATMHAGFVDQGREGILKARAVEDRLMRDTWQADGYDLLPKLQTLSIPTLVISGDYDLIPGEISAHIAGAIPKAQLVTLKDCGHFAYLECSGDVRNVIYNFFAQRRAISRPH
jgi:proline iminopeptidase